MSLGLNLTALTFPEGTEFPGTPQGLLNLFAAYLFLNGQDNFAGINYGDTEPSADNRDRPWFETDGSGNPVGWKSWNGSAWTAIPIVVPCGTTAERPVSPEDGTLYFDTTISVELIYYSLEWHTASGSPGDVKFVAGTVLADVLTANPGWSHYTDGIGKVLAGALADGTDAETDVGSDEITLTEAQLPAHTHGVTGNYGSGGEGGSDNPLYYDAAQAPVVAQVWPVTGSTGSGDPVSVVQATRKLFCLIKD